MTDMTPLGVLLLLAAALHALHVDVSASSTLLRNDRGTRGLSLAATTSSDTGGWGITADYVSANCTGGVPVMIIAENSGCVADDSSSDNCYSAFESVGSSNGELNNTVKSTKGQCVTDPSATIDTLYGDQAYLRIDYFSDSDCSDLTVANAYAADGVCHIVGYSNDMSKIVSAWDNGTVSISSFFNVSDCSGAADLVQTFTKEQLSAGECKTYADGTSSIGYSSSVEIDSSSGSGLSIGAIAILVVGCVAFFL